MVLKSQACICPIFEGQFKQIDKLRWVMRALSSKQHTVDAKRTITNAWIPQPWKAFKLLALKSSPWCASRKSEWCLWFPCITEKVIFLWIWQRSHILVEMSNISFTEERWWRSGFFSLSMLLSWLSEGVAMDELASILAGCSLEHLGFLKINECNLDCVHLLFPLLLIQQQENYFGLQYLYYQQKLLSDPSAKKVKFLYFATVSWIQQTEVVWIDPST